MTIWSKFNLGTFAALVGVFCVNSTLYAQNTLTKQQMVSQINQALDYIPTTGSPTETKLDAVLKIAKDQHATLYDLTRLKDADDKTLKGIIDSTSQLNGRLRDLALRFDRDNPNFGKIHESGAYLVLSIRALKARRKNKPLPKIDPYYFSLLMYDERDLLDGLNYETVAAAKEADELSIKHSLNAFNFIEKDRMLSLGGLAYLHSLVSGYFGQPSTMLSDVVLKALVRRLRAEYEHSTKVRSSAVLSSWHKERQTEFIAKIANDLRRVNTTMSDFRKLRNLANGDLFLEAHILSLAVLPVFEEFYQWANWSAFASANDLTEREIELSTLLSRVSNHIHTRFENSPVGDAAETLGKALMVNVLMNRYFAAEKMDATIAAIAAGKITSDELARYAQSISNLAINRSTLDQHQEETYRSLAAFLSNEGYAKRVLPDPQEKDPVVIHYRALQLIASKLTGLKKSDRPANHDRIARYAFSALKKGSPEAYNYLATFGFTNALILDLRAWATEKPQFGNRIQLGLLEDAFVATEKQGLSAAEVDALEQIAKDLGVQSSSRTVAPPSPPGKTNASAGAAPADPRSAPTFGQRPLPDPAHAEPATSVTRLTPNGGGARPVAAKPIAPGANATAGAPEAPPAPQNLPPLKASIYGLSQKVMPSIPSEAGAYKEILAAAESSYQLVKGKSKEELLALVTSDTNIAQISLDNAWFKLAEIYKQLAKASDALETGHDDYATVFGDLQLAAGRVFAAAEYIKAISQGLPAPEKALQRMVLSIRDRKLLDKMAYANAIKSSEKKTPEIALSAARELQNLGLKDEPDVLPLETIIALFETYRGYTDATFQERFHEAGRPGMPEGLNAEDFAKLHDIAGIIFSILDTQSKISDKPRALSPWISGREKALVRNALINPFDALFAKLATRSSDTPSRHLSDLSQAALLVYTIRRPVNGVFDSEAWSIYLQVDTPPDEGYFDVAESAMRAAKAAAEVGNKAAEEFLKAINASLAWSTYFAAETPDRTIEHLAEIVAEDLNPGIEEISNGVDPRNINSLIIAADGALKRLLQREDADWSPESVESRYLAALKKVASNLLESTVNASKGADQKEKRQVSQSRTRLRNNLALEFFPKRRPPAPATSKAKPAARGDKPVAATSPRRGRSAGISDRGRGDGAYLRGSGDKALGQLGSLISDLNEQKISRIPDEALEKILSLSEQIVDLITSGAKSAADYKKLLGYGSKGDAWFAVRVLVGKHKEAAKLSATLEQGLAFDDLQLIAGNLHVAAEYLAATLQGHKLSLNPLLRRMLSISDRELLDRLSVKNVEDHPQNAFAALEELRKRDDNLTVPLETIIALFDLFLSHNNRQYGLPSEDNDFGQMARGILTFLQKQASFARSSEPRAFSRWVVRMNNVDSDLSNTFREKIAQVLEQAPLSDGATAARYVTHIMGPIEGMFELASSPANDSASSEATDAGSTDAESRAAFQIMLDHAEALEANLRLLASNKSVRDSAASMVAEMASLLGDINFSAINGEQFTQFRTRMTKVMEGMVDEKLQTMKASLQQTLGAANKAMAIALFGDGCEISWQQKP